MNVTIISLLKTGRHITYSKTLPDFDLLSVPGAPRIKFRRPHAPSDMADTLVLRHMLERRREHEVEKFVVVRGSLVMELDPDGMPVSSTAA